MNSLPVRFASAAIAIVLVALIYYFFEKSGLEFLVLIAVILGTRELISLLFKPEDSFTVKGLFYLLMVFLFIFSVWSIQFGALAFACVSIFFFSASLLLQKKFDDLNSLALFQSKSILGFLYLGLLPSFACKLIELPNGVVWFVALLLIVFAGDTFAFIFGILWGSKKIMPLVSPKKTVIGSIGGIIGSLVASFSISFYLENIPLLALLILGLISGVFGQFGDLFESMLKRVADIKDSGNIMPGHGGILDRIDGVLFAAPFVYLFAYYFENSVHLH